MVDLAIPILLTTSGKRSTFIVGVDIFCFAPVWLYLDKAKTNDDVSLVKYVS